MSEVAIDAGERHLEDGHLLQLLDGESGVPAGARAHVESCAVCRERFGALREAADRLRASLPDVALPDLHLHRRAPVRGWMRTFPAAAAAAILILASAAVAMPPVRQWLARQFDPPTVDSGPAPEPVTPGAPAVAVGIVASFIPSDTLLTIRVDARQNAGALELKAVEGGKVSAQAIGAAGTEELLLAPSEIRIMNGPSASADYRISIPAHVRAVRIVIGGREGPTIRNVAGLAERVPLQ
jgi:hypothetical protein